MHRGWDKAIQGAAPVTSLCLLDELVHTRTPSASCLAVLFWLQLAAAQGLSEQELAQGVHSNPRFQNLVDMALATSCSMGNKELTGEPQSCTSGASSSRLSQSHFPPTIQQALHAGSSQARCSALVLAPECYPVVLNP
jgi:hypothetical protein